MPRGSRSGRPQAAGKAHRFSSACQLTNDRDRLLSSPTSVDEKAMAVGPDVVTRVSRHRGVKNVPRRGAWAFPLKRQATLKFPRPSFFFRRPLIPLQATFSELFYAQSESMLSRSLCSVGEGELRHHGHSIRQPLVDASPKLCNYSLE